MEEKKQVLPQNTSAGAVVLFFIFLFVFAKWGPAINFNTSSQLKGNPLVVSGQGKVTVTPDIAKVSFGITENGSSLKKVQDSVNTKSKSLTDAIKKLGILEKDIKTISYNVYPQYDWTSTNNKITGYQVSTSYEVTIKDFDLVNDALVIATSEGANIAGNVSFEINDSTKTEKMNEARVIAVKNAKDKAEGLAKAAGITLGKVVNVSESQENNSRMYAVPMAGGGLETKDVANPDIQPGTTDLDVTVSLSYEVR